TNHLLLNKEINTQYNIQIENEKANEIIDVICKNKIYPHTLMSDIFADELANKILKKLN
ncbi:MAG: hypothetical protein IT215_08485, partial [Chitinophagaceae bacterium]|nr:hypothetical protein [Chitinophagaceae bacterium]